MAATTVEAGGSVAGNRVILSAPAPSTGAEIQLSSNNAGAASVPTTLVIPPGATQATFDVSAQLVPTNTVVQITAAYGGITRSANLTIYPVLVQSVVLTPLQLTAGDSTTTNTVRLTRQAPPSGATVVLTSSNPSVAEVPPTILIPAGTTTTAFSIQTNPVLAFTSVRISATFAGITRTATLSVYPRVLSSLTLSPTAANAGTPTTANKVVITRAAPAGGAAVLLSSSNSSVALVPPQVMVAAGATAATFSIETRAVSAATSVTITAAYGGVTRSANLTVYPVVPSALTLAGSGINAGSSTTTNRVTLTRPAPPGGAEITLVSSLPSAAQVPASIVVPAGATVSPYFTITTYPVMANTAVRITASLNGVVRIANMYVYPVQVSSVSVSPVSVKGGSTTTLNRVTLGRPAPPGGALVILRSSAPLSASVLSTASIPAKATYTTFAIETATVAANTIVQISAEFGGVSKSVNLTVIK
jgi:hypothetical protein